MAKSSLLVLFLLTTFTWKVKGFTKGGSSFKEQLKVDFLGDTNSGSIMAHNFTVICHTTWEKWEPKEDRFTLVNLPPFLCTHVVFNRYVVDKGTGEFRLNDNYDDNEKEMSALKNMKMENQWLNTLMQVESVDFPDDLRQQTNFMKTLFDILKSGDADGMYVFDEGSASSVDFFQDVCRQVREAGFILVIGASYPLAKTPFPSSDFITYRTSGYVLYDKTRHASPYSDVAKGVRNLLTVVPDSRYALLSLSPEASPLLLRTPCAPGSEKDLRCCGLRKEGVGKDDWFPGPEDVGSLSSRVMVDLGLGRLCSVYKEKSGNWTIWRSQPNKEVFMCDGTHWITYQDRASLSSLIELVELHNLGGVDIKYLKLGDARGECDNSNFNSSQKSQYPFFRNVNRLLARLTKNNRTTIAVPARNLYPLVLPLKPSTQACELANALEQHGVPEHERPIWYCLGSTASHFLSTSGIPATLSVDQKGCSSAQFGMLGLSSPLCEDPGRPTTCLAICNVNCGDLMHNISESVKCLLQGMQEPIGFRHRYWAFCEAFTNNETLNVDDCVNFTRTKITADDSANYGTPYVGWLIAIAIAIGLLLAACCGYDWLRHKTRRRDDDEAEFELTNRFPDKVQQLITDLADLGCLLDSKEFTIDYKQRLGNGCFGVVYSATVRGRPAAVKALNEETDERDIISLLSEIKLLSALKSHDNVVAFLGYRIQEEGASELKIHMFLEYCANGCLEAYLREHRSEFEGTLKKEHLILWSFQVANGMEYLTSQNILHGDLAARNVLLDDTRVAKISDFGLSRNMYNYNHYIKKGRVPMPWRWMSIEALRDMKFSSASDVWSYGVTLYEVFSLGSIPYPGLNYTADFVDQLIDLHLRPGRPKQADDYIYQSIIQPCWNEAEVDRPTFADILAHLRPVLDSYSSALGYCTLESDVDT